MKEAYEVFDLQPIFCNAASTLDVPTDEVIDQIAEKLRTSHTVKMILGDHKVKYVVWSRTKMEIFLSWYMYKGIAPDTLPHHMGTVEESVLRSCILSTSVRADESSMFRSFQGLTILRGGFYINLHAADNRRCKHITRGRGVPSAGPMADRYLRSHGYSLLACDCIIRAFKNAEDVLEFMQLLSFEDLLPSREVPESELEYLHSIIELEPPYRYH
ncbi:uncharacterized protein LAESUDRAFT_717339 [Laetiporus sulphureus 93-53]|uniref:Uncharacterized protein n=1 Tax=Laetiporus sulphureus 93-53 TaxID=1314785 RepID=A0A165BU32_9APHY|nr:uncharacterized protein LAESUDRAFT_717339 [Laetiporus sulphureus 93-53]KZT01652.1 hypothetical protein LAESUDRAFT_717339 [Laetiporus sulphureus 93-53]